MSNNHYIGTMSGTSMDGLDVVLVQFEPQLKIIASLSTPYPKKYKKALQELASHEQISLQMMSKWHHQLGLFAAECINHLMSTQPHKPIAIGHHGQTIAHHPEYAMSWQLGCCHTIAQQTGIATIGGFRQADMAAGGQGAPLAPLFHQAFLAHNQQKRIVINIGGIANVTLLSGTEIIASFDTGPGNCLMDAWCQEHWGLPYDENGFLAKEGKISSPLLNALLKDCYFSKAPPKSTGTQYFNLKWLSQYLASEPLDPKDVLATLNALTVKSLSMGVKQCGFLPEKVILCGGGSQNKTLLEQITTLGWGEVHLSDEFLIHHQSLEAAAFAWLAKVRLAEEKLSLKNITGSAKPVLLGTLFPV